MKRLLGLIIVLASLFGQATTITTTKQIKDPAGNPLNGRIIFHLPAPATDTTNQQVVTPVAPPVRVNNGFLVGTVSLVGNDIMSPKMYYSADLYDSTNRWLSTYRYYVNGATFDLGAAPMTPITTSNISTNNLGPLASVSTASLCYSQSGDFATLIVSASCGYHTWAAALADCPSGGCILDGTAPDVPLSLGTFDTGSDIKPITVRLGRTLASGCFTATQIVVRQGLDFGGSGILDTCITSVGTNAQPLFVNPQSNNNAITVKLHDFTINGLSGNTSQDGMFFDCSTLTNAGVELSRWDNIIISGFNGVGMHFKATQDSASGSIGCTQGNTFTNIMSTRPTGATGATQNALRIEGGAGQFEFINCWFTGATNDTGTNVFVGTTGSQAPYSIHFHGTTNQNGNSYLFDGGTSYSTDNDHCESIKVMYTLKTTSQLLVGVNIKTPHINSNCGVNAGNGAVVLIPNTAVNVDGVLDTPLVYSTPDKLINNLAGNSTSFRPINARTFNSSTPANVYSTTGVTGTLNVAATVDLKSWDTIFVNTSGTSMTTFKSTKSPGESVVLCAVSGTIQFALGGNLSLGNNLSPFIVQSGDCATFHRTDQGASSFVLVGWTRQATINVDLTAQTANVGSTLLYAVPSTGAGTYRVTVYIVVTSVGTTSTMPNIVIAYTDKDNSTAQSVPFTTTNTGNTLTTLAVNSLPISAKASTNINWSTTSYASTGSAMQYAAHIKLEYIGP